MTNYLRDEGRQSAVVLINRDDHHSNLLADEYQRNQNGYTQDENMDLLKSSTTVDLVE